MSCGRYRPDLRQAFGKAAINAAILFFVGNGERQNFLFGQIGKSFQGRSSEVTCSPVYAIF